MLYFSLPYFVENKDFNDKLVKYVLNYKDITISSCYGNFPYSYWSGDNNTCLGDKEVFTCHLVEGFMHDVSTAIEIDASNLFLEEKDFHLPHLKMILDNIKDAGHFVKILNPNFLSLLPRSTQGILGVSACYVADWDSNTVNDLFNLYPELNGMEIPDTYDIDWSKIKHKDHIIIVIGDKCGNCADRKACVVAKHNNQFNFSIKDIDCNIESHTDWVNQIENFKKKGFTRFRFSTPSVNDLNNFNKKLIKYFIREEDQYEFYSSWLV